jgi:hypothetical protein
VPDESPSMAPHTSGVGQIVPRWLFRLSDKGPEPLKPPTVVARLRAVLDGLRSSDPSCSSRYRSTAPFMRPSNYGSNSTGKCVPGFSILQQGAVAGARDLVYTPAARCSRRPTARQKASRLEMMQRGIDRALRQVEYAATRASQPLDDGIAVRRLFSQDREQEHIEISLEEVRLHTEVG